MRFPSLFLCRAVVPLLIAAAPALSRAQGEPPEVASVVWKQVHQVSDDELLGDPDGDGYETWVEGQFGTDPRSATSVPALRVVSYGAGGAQVFWDSVAGARVQPETTTTLGAWQPLGGPLTGTGISMAIPLPDSQSPRFFRLRALPVLDDDNDGLNSLDEALLGTDPALADTDADSFSDSNEFGRGWNPVVPELHPFWREKYGVAWSAVELDTDGDGFTAREESAFGTDPGNAASKPDLTVGRGQAAGTAVLRWTGVAGVRYQLVSAGSDLVWAPWGIPIVGAGAPIEVAFTTPADETVRLWRLTALPPADGDADGLDAYGEALAGTDPQNPDSDGDGASDGYEVVTLKTNPLRGVQAPTLATPSGAVATPTLVLTGQAEPGETVTVSGGTLPISAVADATGGFSATVTLNPNRLNRLSVSSRNAADQTGPVRTVEIIHDAQPPALHVDFPGNNAQLSTETATIAGRVADSLSGYQGLTVTVNGQPANVMVGIGTNGTYERASMPLAVGENPITVVARDIHGNSTTKSILVYRADPAAARILAVGGGGQTGTVHRRMPTPIEVEVRDASNQPWPGKVVKFTVIRSDGRLAPAATHPTAGDLVFQAITDATGRAKAWWVLGGDAGCGNNRVEVTTDGIPGSAFFCASANPGPASQINIGSGNTQTGEVNGFAREPLRIWVSDSCNGIQGVNVTFQVTRGGGKVNGQDTVTVPTTRTGHAQVDFQLGPEPGNHVVEATYPGFTGSPAVFTTRGLARTPDQPTSFTAIAQDNAGQPIGGATAYIKVAGQLVGPVPSTSDGVINFPALPAAGPAELLVDAKPATQLGGQPLPAGSFPALSFQLILVPNAANEHPGPVLFPKLNPANSVKFDGTHDVMLTCASIEGLQFIVRAGSMTRANGTKPSAASPEFLTLNQVAHDDVPMPMPDGASPPFAWTFQPAGATFNPPVEIRYPNMSGLPPGSIAYFLSYDHAVEKFDIVSSGHVTADGAHIVTDAGSGLTLSGWGCNCPPYSVTGECERQCRLPGPQPWDGKTDRDKCKEDRCKQIAEKLTAKAVANPGLLREQIACLARKACIELENSHKETRPTFIDDFILDELQDLAENEMPSASLYDSLGTYLNPNNEPLFEFNVGGTVVGVANPANLVLGVFAGLDHFALELIPGFVRNCDKRDNANHNNFLRYIMADCFTEMRNLGAIPAWLAPIFVQNFADAAGDLAVSYCQIQEALGNRPPTGGIGGGSDIAAELRALPASPALLNPERFFIPDLSELGTLKVEPATPEFQVASGSTVQLRAETHAPDVPVADVTAGATGTRYFAFPRTAGILVTTDGRVTFHSPLHTGPTFWPARIIAVNGRHIGVAQFLVRTADTDRDRLSDDYEVRVGRDPLVAESPRRDGDGDGLTDLTEALVGTWANLPDSDGDGVDDRLEFAQGSDPSVASSSRPLMGSGLSLKIGAQVGRSEGAGFFKIESIAAADQFGVGGPGTSPDFLSDDPVRVAVLSNRWGVRTYGSTDPFRISNRSLVQLVAERFSFSSTPIPLPESLTITAPRRTLTSIGQTTQLTVTSTQLGGGTLDVTSAAQWTTYRSSNIGIVNVNADGLCAAVGPGSAFITTTNEGVSAVARIDVVPGAALTSISAIIRTPDGNLLPGADVNVMGYAANSKTNISGRVAISDIPTLSETVNLMVTWSVAGHKYFGMVRDLTVSFGINNEMGYLTVTPTVPQWFGNFSRPSDQNAWPVILSFVDASGGAITQNAAWPTINNAISEGSAAFLAVFDQAEINRWDALGTYLAQTRTGDGTWLKFRPDRLIQGSNLIMNTTFYGRLQPDGAIAGVSFIDGSDSIRGSYFLQPSTEKIAGTYFGKAGSGARLKSLVLMIGDPDSSGALHAQCLFFADNSNGSVATGRFTMDGTYDPLLRSLTLSPLRWLDQPAGASLWSLEADLGDNGRIISGTITEAGSGDLFSLERLSSSIVSLEAPHVGPWYGTYTASQGLTRTLIVANRGNFSHFLFFADNSNPSVPTGHILSRMTYDPDTDSLTSVHESWLLRPSGYNFLSWSGELDVPNGIYSGTFFECSRVVP